MAGAAAVAAAMIALSVLKPKVAVTAYLPIAENMISGTAYRPGDVVTMYGGKRVEVLNTDAEGRMILADAIARAAEDEPDYLFETSHAHRRPGGRARQADRRASWATRTCASGSARPVTASASRPGRCRSPTTYARAWTPTSPTSPRSTRAWTGPATCCRAARSSASSCRRAWPGRTSTSPGRRYHSGEPTGYRAKGGTGVPVRTLLDLIEDIAANG